MNFEENNTKKIICFNIININKCIYNDKCRYAHSLEEQHIDLHRQETYDLLNLNDLSKINLIKKKYIRENLEILTKICNDCVNNKCPGGYNCKFGACSNKFLICKDDLLYGTCHNENCDKGIHLTKKGLLPIDKQEDIYTIKNKIKGERVIKSYIYNIC